MPSFQRFCDDFCKLVSYLYIYIYTNCTTGKSSYAKFTLFTIPYKAMSRLARSVCRDLSTIIDSIDIPVVWFATFKSQKGRRSFFSWIDCRRFRQCVAPDNSCTLGWNADHVLIESLIKSTRKELKGLHSRCSSCQIQGSDMAKTC